MLSLMAGMGIGLAALSAVSSIAVAFLLTALVAFGMGTRWSRFVLALRRWRRGRRP